MIDTQPASAGDDDDAPTSSSESGTSTGHARKADTSDSPTSQHRIEPLPRQGNTDETPIVRHSGDHPKRPTGRVEKF